MNSTEDGVMEIKKEGESGYNNMQSQSMDHSHSYMNHNSYSENATASGSNCSPAVRRNGPSMQFGSVFHSNHSDHVRGRPAARRHPSRRYYHRSRSLSSSSGSRSRSRSPSHRRLLTEAEFQRKTMEFQRQMLKMQRKTVRMLQEIKQDLHQQNSQRHFPPERNHLGPIQESLVSIQNHEKEKSLLLLESHNSNGPHSVSDVPSMESSADQREHAPTLTPQGPLQLDQIPPMGWQNSLPSIISLSPHPIIENPLTTVEDLRDFEESLKEDNDKMILLVQQICRLGAVDCKDMIKRGLRSLMKKSLMEMLNMDGQRSETTGKMGFKSSVVCAALTDAALLRFPDVGRAEILKLIQLQLRYSKRQKEWN